MTASPILLMPISQVAERLACTERRAAGLMREAGLLVTLGGRRRPLHYVVPDALDAYIAARIAAVQPTALAPLPRHLRPVRRTA